VPAATVQGWLRRMAERLDAVGSGLCVWRCRGGGRGGPGRVGVWRDARSRRATGESDPALGAVGLLGAVTPDQGWAVAASGGRCWRRAGHTAEPTAPATPIGTRRCSRVISGPRHGACPARPGRR